VRGAAVTKDTELDKRIDEIVAVIAKGSEATVHSPPVLIAHGMATRTPCVCGPEQF